MLNSQDSGDLRCFWIHAVDQRIGFDIRIRFLMLRAEMAAKIDIQIPVCPIPVFKVNMEFRAQRWSSEDGGWLFRHDEPHASASNRQ